VKAPAGKFKSQNPALNPVPELLPQRILIADDHPVFRRGLHQIIAAQPAYRVEEAADGVSALRLIQSFKPEVCILDINMPNLDGLGVLRAMRRQHLPGQVIFLTMHKEEDLFNEALNLGAKGYVLKESAVGEILQSIETVAAGRSYISPGLTDYLLSRHEGARILAQEKPGLARLTPTERRILKLIAEDKTSKEIAQDLGISPRTVENHRTNICEKLDVHGIHALVKFAYQNQSRL